MARTGRWSLAARLTGWYAFTAFLLVTAAALLQYRALVTSLASEDDQELVERIDAARAANATNAATNEHAALLIEPNGREGVRLLSETCRPIGAIALHLPPPICALPQALPHIQADQKIHFRSWRSRGDHMWRIASVHARTTDGKVDGGWIEAFMDRSTDEKLLHAYRNDLAMVLGASLVGALLLGYGIARRGLRPLAELGERIKRIDARSLDQRLGTQDSPSEIGALVSSFDAMLSRLEGAFKALSELSAELAHELRTPLHVLRQQSEIALGRVRSVEEYGEILASSLEELNRLDRMADNMLFLARMEDPRSSIDRQPLALVSQLKDVAEYLDAMAAEAGITLEVDAADDIRVLADRMLVRRALVNLVTNAVRHAPSGSCVHLSARANDVSVLVCVEDTGDGIPSDALPRVFDRYFRVANAESDRKTGSGLGLAIVRGIMQLHGGTAGIASIPGRGTRVTLEFAKL